MARRDDCYRFARTWGLKIISVDALAEYAAREGSGRIPKAQDLEV
jgi:3,4-dihydroxy 2-butanone 4-phosphate synthase